MDLLDQLRVFLRVAHGGGFSAAAEQLDMPRPTVSLAVQRLEARLGARLFSRTTRRVSLTADGQALLERAAVLLADAQELEQQFRPQGAALSGRLRVDLPSRIARRLVAPALPDFFERHPGVTLELGSSDRAIDLVQEGVDCALRVGELASSSLVARPLGQLAVVTCASPGYLQRHGVPRHPDELPRHQAVQYAATAGGRPAPWEWLEQGQLHGKAMPGRVTVGNAETYIACALAGLGLIQVPAYDVQEHLASGALVQVLGDCAQPGMAVHLVVSHRRHLSARVQAFGSWLAGVLEPHFRVAAALQP
ncbi:LysR family transcriptional regulator [Comamonas badia]|uniref:LysR family transcriptional regulator n=1 Tax=Comamonas badia TaxID=265291 RepID=UPI0004146A21|nr:LysR family transcriptional regulator [Comamonas badia]